MGTLYILKSLKNDRFYVGSTINFSRRISQHRKGKSKYTKNLHPLELVFRQEYQNILSARRAEKWIKRQKSRKLIERIIIKRKIEKSF